MGLLDLFKPKEKTNLKLLKLQNIVYQNDYDKIIFPEQQILDYACNIYIPQITRIIDDSIELVNNSVVLDTFFFRLNLVIEKFNELVVLENLMVINAPLPSEQLNDVLEKYNSVIQDFLERYTEKCIREINKMKTTNDKITKIEKFSTEIFKYKKHFTTSHLEYINTVLENELNRNFYENSNKSEIGYYDSATSALPYYLDKMEKISSEEIVSELKEWTRTGTLNKDKKYDSMIKRLEIIKNNINFAKDQHNNNIELCSEGLELSIKLCEYCIDKGYDTLRFVRSQTKNHFNYFTEQLRHWKVYNSYNKACQYEKDGNFEQAMELYLDILRNNTPTGTLYYTKPFNLSINLFNYADALEIHKYLKENYIENNIENLKDIYENYSNIINTFISYENNYSIIKSRIINFLENNPGILQTTFYKEINLEDKKALRFILYHFEKLSLIKREKSGRSYKIYLT